MTQKLTLIEGKGRKGTVVLVNPSSKPLYFIKPEHTFDGIYSIGDSFVHCVVLDNYYLSKIRSKRKINLPHQRRGRSLELLLFSPLQIEQFPEISFYVASFKGAGAIPEDGSSKEYLIDPITWRSSGAGEVQQCGRIWGGMESRFALAEARNNALSQRGIFHTPYVAQNKIPNRVQEEIYQKSGRKKQGKDPDLYQIVRLSMTNIRYDEFMHFTGDEVNLFAALSYEAGWTAQEWALHLGKVDGILTKESLELEKEGKFFDFYPKGLMDDNRYITGEITDFEQVTISKYNERPNWWAWPMAVMCQSKDFLRRVSMSRKIDVQSIINIYFDRLSEISRFQFTGGCKGQEEEHMHQNHVREYLKYASLVRRENVKSKELMQP